MSCQNSRAISGVVDRPIETCPECGESEKIRAYKYTDDNGFWSQCIPCRDRASAANIAGLLPTFDGWFLEPETKPLEYDFMQKVLELRDKWVGGAEAGL